MSSFKKLSPDELKAAVLDFQKGDSLAAELLRLQFSPLIYRLTHRHSVRSVFGEDAENIAWLLFFEFLANYQGVNYIRLPGLVRRFMIFRLMNGIAHHSFRYNLELLDQFDRDSPLCQLASGDSLDASLDKALLEDLFEDLPKMQQEVLRQIYLQDKTQEQVAMSLQCSPRYVRKCKNLGLSNIKKKLNKNA